MSNDAKEEDSVPDVATTFTRTDHSPVITIAGAGGDGKSTSLQYIHTNSELLYLNGELLGQDLPWDYKGVKEKIITTPKQARDFLTAASVTDSIKYAVVDTLTGLMSGFLDNELAEMDTLAKWNIYGIEYRTLLTAANKCTKPVFLMMHLEAPSGKRVKWYMPISGASGYGGTQKMFGHVYICRIVSVALAKQYPCKYLKITPEDEKRKFKIVYQVQQMDEFPDMPIKTREVLWNIGEPMIDGNAMLLLAVVSPAYLSQQDKKNINEIYKLGIK